MITYRRCRDASAKRLDVDAFLSEVVLSLIKVEGTVRVLQRSLWEVEQNLVTPEKWGNESAAELIADYLQELRDQIEHYQIDLKE